MFCNLRTGMPIRFIVLTILFLMTSAQITMGLRAIQVTTRVFDVDSRLFLLCAIVTLFCSYCFKPSGLHIYLLYSMQQFLYRTLCIFQRAMTWSIQAPKILYGMGLHLFGRIRSRSSFSSSSFSTQFSLDNEWIDLDVMFWEVILAVTIFASVIFEIPQYSELVLVIVICYLRVVYGLVHEIPEFSFINGHVNLADPDNLMMQFPSQIEQFPYDMERLYQWEAEQESLAYEKDIGEGHSENKMPKEQANDLDRLIKIQKEMQRKLEELIDANGGNFITSYSYESITNPESENYPFPSILKSVESKDKTTVQSSSNENEQSSHEFANSNNVNEIDLRFLYSVY